MSPLCNSGLSRSNSPDLNKAAAAENSSNAKASYTQAALHVDVSKEKSMKAFHFLPNAGCITLRNRGSARQGTQKKPHTNQKNREGISALVIHTHQDLKVFEIPLIVL